MESNSAEPADERRPEDPSASEPPVTLNESIWQRARKALNEVSSQASSAGGAFASKAAEAGTVGVVRTVEVTREVMESGRQVYAGSRIESAIKYVDGELEQRGAKKAIQSSAEAVVDKLDQVTGKRLVELLEAKLRVQDEYNDILATRLAEALERLDRLESRFKNDD